MTRLGWGDRNIAKAVHAEEVKENIASEAIFVDTSRIASEGVAIGNIRRALRARGPDRVIAVATKIDASPT